MVALGDTPVFVGDGCSNGLVLIMGLSRVQIVTGAVPAMSSLPIRMPESHCGPVDAAVVAVVAGGAPAGLLEALGAVDDPSQRRGLRHSFTALLATGVCAVLTGARSYAAVAEWRWHAGSWTAAGRRANPVTQVVLPQRYPVQGDR